MLYTCIKNNNIKREKLPRICSHIVLSNFPVNMLLRWPNVNSVGTWAYNTVTLAYFYFLVNYYTLLQVHINLSAPEENIFSCSCTYIYPIVQIKMKVCENTRVPSPIYCYRYATTFLKLGYLCKRNYNLYWKQGRTLKSWTSPAWWCYASSKNFSVLQRMFKHPHCIYQIFVNWWVGRSNTEETIAS